MARIDADLRNKIYDRLGNELYCQLAEECSELAQAALKMRRVLDGTNPTQKTEEECLSNLIEEFTDVVLVADILGINTDNAQLVYKVNRWCGRLGID